MLLYQLAILRTIKYFKLDELFKEEERPLSLKKKKKVVKKLVLETDPTLVFLISLLLSLLGVLLSISIPFAILERPLDIFIERELYTTYVLAEWFYAYRIWFDYLLIALIVSVSGVTYKTLNDAVRNTNISISPWIVQGKYYLPPNQARKECLSYVRVYK